MAKYYDDEAESGTEILHVLSRHYGHGIHQTIQSHTSTQEPRMP